MRERDIERSFAVEVKKHGGIAVKFVSPGLDGMPDRIALFPDGKIGFVEVKAPGRKPRPLQKKRHEQLRGLGFRVYVLDDKNQIKEIIDDIRTT